MKRAKYVITLHGKGGPYKHVPFEGTRIEARAKAKELRSEREGTGSKIHFMKYLNEAT